MEIITRWLKSRLKGPERELVNLRQINKNGFIWETDRKMIEEKIWKFQRPLGPHRAVQPVIRAPESIVWGEKISRNHSSNLPALGRRVTDRSIQSHSQVRGKNQKTKLAKRVRASKMKMKINSWKQQEQNDTFHRWAMVRLMGLHPKCGRPEILRLRRVVTKKNTCQPKGIARKINLQK